MLRGLTIARHFVMAIKATRNATCGSQEFRTPSVFSGPDPIETTIVDVFIVDLQRDNKTITTKGADGKDVTKGFIVFQTDKSNEEFIFLTSLLRTRTGLDKEENLISIAPQGTFIEKVRTLLATVSSPATLDKVVNTLTALKTTKIRITNRSYFARTTDGRVYEAFIRDIDIVE